MTQYVWRTVLCYWATLWERENGEKQLRWRTALPSLPGEEAPSPGRGIEGSEAICEQQTGSTRANCSCTSRRSQRRAWTHTSSPLHTIPA